MTMFRTLIATARRLTLAAVLPIAGLAFGAGVSDAATITYVLPDIGTFPDYTNPNEADTWAGNGFVGMYNFGGELEWAHLFGIEMADYSRTIGQVDLSGLAGGTINSATFSFDIKHGSLGSAQIVRFSSFAEDGSLNYSWSPPAPLGSTLHPGITGGTNTLNVTSHVASFLAGGGDWFGFHLEGRTAYHWTYTYTGFGYHADAAAVRLTVDYEPGPARIAQVPEPFSLALLALGGVGIMFRRARLG